MVTEYKYARCLEFPYLTLLLLTTMTENDHLRTAVNAAVSVDTQNKTEDAFRGVAEILAGASDIGPDHELWKNWNALRLVSMI